MVSDHRRRLLKTTVGVGRLSFHFLPLPSFLSSRTLPLSRPLFSPFPPYPCSTPLRSCQEILGNAVAPSGSGRSKAAKYSRIFWAKNGTSWHLRWTVTIREGLPAPTNFRLRGDRPTQSAPMCVVTTTQAPLKLSVQERLIQQKYKAKTVLKYNCNVCSNQRHSNGQQISLVWTIRKTTNIICTKNAKCFYEKADFAGNIAAKKLWMRLVYNHKLASNLHSAVVYIIKHISTKQVK